MPPLASRMRSFGARNGLPSLPSVTVVIVPSRLRLLIRLPSPSARHQLPPARPGAAVGAIALPAKVVAPPFRNKGEDAMGTDIEKKKAPARRPARPFREHNPFLPPPQLGVRRHHARYAARRL